MIHLHYDDISRSNMQIHVRDTKKGWTAIPFSLNVVWISLHNTGLRKVVPVASCFRINLPVITDSQYSGTGMRRAVADAELPKTATPTVSAIALQPI